MGSLPITSVTATGALQVPASHREALDGGRVKGGMLRSHLEWATARRPEALAEIRKCVSPETQKILRTPILPVSWYPFRAIIESDRAIAELIGSNQVRDTLVDLGRYSAEVNLTTSYKAFGRNQPHEFFQSIARLHRQFQDFGSVEYEPLGSFACRLSMYGYVCYSKIYCWSALGYYEQATLLEGGQQAEVHEVECLCESGRACHFEIRWS